MVSYQQRLGLPAFRVNTGGHGAEDDPRALEQCIKSFKELVKEAEATGVKLLIENHWGISINPLNTLRIIEEVDSEMLGTLPDFGNFPDSQNPRGLELLQEASGGLPADGFATGALSDGTTPWRCTPRCTPSTKTARNPHRRRPLRAHHAKPVTKDTGASSSGRRRSRRRIKVKALLEASGAVEIRGR